MLRGINVGGKKIVRMENLRASFEALGFGRVKTYVQSGNVSFEAVKASPDDLSKTIAEKISKDFGFPISVVVRTSDEIGKIVGGNPFLNERGLDPSKLHVTFWATPRPVFQIICDQGSGLQERFVEKDKMENRPLSVLISVLDDAPLIA